MLFGFFNTTFLLLLSKYILLPSSIVASIIVDLDTPMPLILFSLFIVELFKLFNPLNSFNISLDNSLTDLFLVPHLNIIDNNSLLDNFYGPYFIIRSLGLSSNGISFINITSPIILLYKTL